MIMGVKIRLHDGELIAQALRRFKKLLERAGVPWEIRRHSHFISATGLRRRKQFRKFVKSRSATVMAQIAGKQPVR
jgi:ribosomal protein S21